jgi:hypothetical protein
MTKILEGKQKGVSFFIKNEYLDKRTFLAETNLITNDLDILRKNEQDLSLNEIEEALKESVNIRSKAQLFKQLLLEIPKASFLRKFGLKLPNKLISLLTLFPNDYLLSIENILLELQRKKLQ